MSPPGVPGGCEHPRGSREANSGPEQQALLASELTLQPTTRHPCMDLELIVEAVVPSDHCDSYRNRVIFTEMIAISSQTKTTYVIIKKKILPPSL